MWHRLWLLWGTVILLTGILPLSNFIGQPQWDNIHWFITTNDVRHRRFFLDILLNIGLYIPFGFFYARYALTNGCRDASRGLRLAFVLSGSIESYQVFCDHRFPSILDLLNNTAGAVIGVVAAKLLHTYLSPSAPLTPTLPDRTPAP